MEITAESIKQLREKTGVSVMQCKEALAEAGGDLARAEEILHKSSGGIATKKAGRALAAGIIGSYVHDGTIGALALLSCETDFVAKNPEFAALARELAMQVSAMNPENADALLAQPFIKDAGKTVKDLLNEATQKFGERVEVSEFARLSAR
ncbi:elongation factor Ts [Candidatus Kaiserbacteria bacterium]|nr:elongation factor Ts [Candidatus Kaiserbacteria bacterium]